MACLFNAGGVITLVTLVSPYQVPGESGLEWLREGATQQSTRISAAARVLQAPAAAACGACPADPLATPRPPLVCLSPHPVTSPPSVSHECQRTNCLLLCHQADRDEARKRHEEQGLTFLEVFMDVPITVVQVRRISGAQSTTRGGARINEGMEVDGGERHAKALARAHKLLLFFPLTSVAAWFRPYSHIRCVAWICLPFPLNLA